MKGAIGGILPAAIPLLRGHLLRAIRRIANAAPPGFCHGRCRLFSGALRPPVDERLGCPANTGYPRSL
jgi:hypothetical protein